MTAKPATPKLIPWDEMIHILNRLQANHPNNRQMEYVNKWVNDEIYEYFENKAYEEFEEKE